MGGFCFAHGRSALNKLYAHGRSALNKRFAHGRNDYPECVELMLQYGAVGKDVEEVGSMPSSQRDEFDATKVNYVRVSSLL